MPLRDYQYNPDFKDIIAALNAEDVSYLIVGGYAIARYLKPRVTKDFDIWVEASEINAPRVWRALVKFGAPAVHFSESDFQTPGITLQLGIEPNRIDIMTRVSGLAFERAWLNRQEGDFGGLPAWYIAPGDLLANKRAADRSQDHVDAEALEKAGFHSSEE
jgi:hypothetical protein